METIDFLVGMSLMEFEISKEPVKPGFDFQILAEEILRALRAGMNQRELSSRLGFSFNQVGKWETGATKIKWHDFLKLASALHISTEQNFREVFWNFNGEFGAASSLDAIFKHTSLSDNPSKEAKLRKWTMGLLEPDFAEILEAMYFSPAILFGWLSKFVDCANLESIRAPYLAYAQMINSVFEDPICVYVNAALGLKGYADLENHDDRFVALHATCSVPHARKVLNFLRGSGLVQFDGVKFRPCPANFSFSTAANPKVRSLTKYTTTLAAERYPLIPLSTTRNVPSTASIGSVRVVAISVSAASELRDLIARFQSEAAKIIARDSGEKAAVQILLVQSFGSTANAPDSGSNSGPS